MEPQKRNTATKIAGVAFLGCMMLGLGFGMALERTAVGLFIGTGSGFILMGLTWAFYGKGKEGNEGEGTRG
ncbi:MAG: hypothetical protein HYY40_05165 [Bacteroidetes bacterium]|nr:hypothetical protein [Bacteroidota bacterium]